MFNRILVALDGSDHAAHALTVAIDLSQRCGATLVLFHSVQAVPLSTDFDPMVIHSAREVYAKLGREQAQAILGVAREQASAAGVTELVDVIGDGDPVKAMLEELKTNPADLVVVGTRGLSGLQEIAVGSVAHKVTIAAPCPVLVTK